MGFQIKRIACRIVDHDLRTDRIILSAAGRHDCSRYLLIAVYDEDGTIGYGEAATTAIWSGETAETSRHLVEKYFAPALTDATLDHPCESIPILDSIIHGHPFTKAAIETALWDLWAKELKKPVAALINDRPPVRSIPTRISIGAYAVDKTVAIARECWEAGVRTLKFKTGLPDTQDADRLQAVRDILGPEAVFTVDYNGAFDDTDTAVRAIESILPFDLALVEQPTHRDRLSLLAAVRQQVDVPVMADEAVFTSQDLEEALSLDAFDILSVYPGKNGGFSRSIEMVRKAQKAGKVCAIGSNLETDLGQAAMATLAASMSAFPIEQLACDLGSAFYYLNSSVQNPTKWDDGCYTLPQGDGFGVEPVGAVD